LVEPPAYTMLRRGKQARRYTKSEDRPVLAAGDTMALKWMADRLKMGT
jgi:hypothetical protein